MSGHSKWHNIRERKTAVSASRGKIFTRYARLIEIAARGPHSALRASRGEGDPMLNPRLRTVIENARAENVPKDIIDRAIKKGMGELKGEAQSEEILYEAFGPAGTAYLIECLTDNRQRTIANVKALLHRHDGRLAENGAVSWMFEERGIMRVNLAGKNPEELELLAIDAGATDVLVEGDILHIETPKTDLARVRDALKNAGCSLLQVKLEYVPKETVEIKDAETAKRVFAFVEALEGDDDVTEVHTNAGLREETVQQPK